MAKSNLTLLPSISMDNNKKENRNEDSLIRLSKSSRENLNLTTKVEVYLNNDNTENRIKSAKLLDIFKAFTKDMKDCKDKNMSPEELVRVGFVTTKTFKMITGNIKKNSVWIADNVNDTVIGADPEFLLFDQHDEVVRANNVLSYHGELGCDGAMAEVRPKPAISPEELVINILKILKNANITDPITPYKWVAGCYYKDKNRDYPIGGHIHIGNPVQIANMDNNKQKSLFIVLNKIIDELLAIPMIKIDGSIHGSARRTKCTMGKYGYYGELRTCNGRLEHRTLSGMWLMHPTLATCVLGTVKAIIDEVFNLVINHEFDINYILPNKLEESNVPNELKNSSIWSANFKRWKEIPLAVDMGCTADSQFMIEFLNKSEAGRINAVFINNWYKKMKTLSTYKTYAKYIDGFTEMLKIGHNEYNKFDKTLQKNWLEGKKFIINF